MKIKTKKQLNLPQLIEWAMDNDMHGKSFYGDRYGNAVYFDKNEDILCDRVSLIETFTVEEEIKITEDTVLPRSLLLYDDGDTTIGTNRSINSYHRRIAQAIYLMNDDLTMTLLWTKEKGMVE